MRSSLCKIGEPQILELLGNLDLRIDVAFFFSDGHLLAQQVYLLVGRLTCCFRQVLGFLQRLLHPGVLFAQLQLGVQISGALRSGADLVKVVAQVVGLRNVVNRRFRFRHRSGSRHRLHTRQRGLRFLEVRLCLGFLRNFTLRSKLGLL